MDLAKYDDKLRRRQMAYSEGLHLMKLTREELVKTIAGANGWGLTAVLSNAALVPLNIIVNAFAPASPATWIQAVAKFVYDKKAKSGTRGQSSEAKMAIDVAGKIGEFAAEQVKNKGLKHMVPGVKILAGLAQDSIALIDVANLVGSGQREMTMQLRAIDRKMADAIQTIQTIGIERALVHDEMDRIRRTA
ncbi:hypothetical protein [Tsuneonella sp. SYSU-LHT278]|uniref:hypothetical protein n=1 Tax=Tsuneonella sediminis TaxID=3416089 RepID=UPI003F78EC54